MRRVKRTSVLKGRCSRTFVEMPRMHRNDATMQRHAHREYKHAFVHAYLCSFINAFNVTRAPVGVNMMAVTSLNVFELLSIAVFPWNCLL